MPIIELATHYHQCRRRQAINRIFDRLFEKSFINLTNPIKILLILYNPENRAHYRISHPH